MPQPPKMATSNLSQSAVPVPSFQTCFHQWFVTFPLAGCSLSRKPRSAYLRLRSCHCGLIWQKRFGPLWLWRSLPDTT